MIEFRRAVVVGVVIAFVLGGCSIKLAYNNAERLARWQVGEYIDLDREQKAYFTKEFHALMQWHRTTQLPEYSSQLYTMADQYSDGVTPAQIEATFERMMLWGQRVEEKGMYIAVNLMQGLSDAQLAELPANFERSNVEIEEDELANTIAENQADWAQEFEDAMERFTGRLDDRQRDYLVRRSLGYQPERKHWADYRRRWQGAMLKLLEERGADDFDARFRALSTDRVTHLGDYASVSEANIVLSRDVASYMLSNLSEKQSERLRDSLRELADDFAELARET